MLQSFSNRDKIIFPMFPKNAKFDNSLLLFGNLMSEFWTVGQTKQDV